jgi:hypothetical protein
MTAISKCHVNYVHYVTVIMYMMNHAGESKCPSLVEIFINHYQYILRFLAMQNILTLMSICT